MHSTNDSCNRGRFCAKMYLIIDINNNLSGEVVAAH